TPSTSSRPRTTHTPVQRSKHSSNTPTQQSADTPPTPSPSYPGAARSTPHPQLLTIALQPSCCKGHRRGGRVDDTGPRAGDAEQPPDGGESSPPLPQAERARRGRPPPPPLKVRVELVLVSGPEGRQLRQLQAAAMREALRWFAEHPTEHPDPDSHPTPDES